MTIQANFPAIKPSLMLDFANTKQLDSRITYTRASTASYYDGVTTAMAEQNLLTYSQEFDNAAWSSFSNALTRTANQTTAPDGTTTADSVVGDGTTNIHYFGQLVTLSSTSTYAFSFYAKANGLNYVQVFLGSGTSFANFDITSGAGATGTSGGQFGSLAIQDAGSGWFRCSLIMTNPSSSNVYFCLVNSASSARAPSIAVSTGIYLWGAQLEQRSAVTAYTATTTQAITNYIPKLQSAASGVARFDNNPTTGESLGLLIEESRTNLLTYSAQFDNAAWTKANLSVTADTIVAPDGTLSGEKLVESATTSVHSVTQSVSVTSGTAYTATIYAKASQRSFLIIQPFGNSFVAYFNLTTGAVGTVNGSPTSTSITSVGNGWYRCSITATASSTGSVNFIAYTAATDGTASYAGDGFSGIFIWGAQLEAGAFATSYIPTVASQVTRAADAASMTGTNFSSWFNVSQGTVYADGNTKSNTNACLLTASAASYGVGNGLLLRQNNTLVQFGGNNSSTISGSVTINSNVRSAAFYQGLNATSAANGGSLSSITNLDFTGVGTTTLYIGFLAGPNQVFNGTIKKIAYYPLAVTSAQLQALTS